MGNGDCWRWTCQVLLQNVARSKSKVSRRRVWSRRSCRHPDGSFRKLPVWELRKTRFARHIHRQSARTVAVGKAVVSTGGDGVDGGRRRPIGSDTADGDRHRLRRSRSVDAGRHRRRRPRSILAINPLRVRVYRQ